MKDIELIRVGQRTYRPDGKLNLDHGSINKAKRWVREYQGNRPGDGRVRVPLKAPAKQEAA